MDTGTIDVKKLKAGDRVGIFAAYPHDRRVTTVTKVTASGQIVTAEGHRFSRYGREIGSDCARPRSLGDPDYVAEQIAYEEAARQLRVAYRALTERFGDLCGGQRSSSHPTPLTPAERAELLALIDRCSGPTTTEEG